MVQVPLLFPRDTLPLLRLHVETLHGRPFGDVIAEVRARNLGFSQHSLIGTFLYHHGHRIVLDGTDAAGGIFGVHSLAWGREEMFPHVGRHVGWELFPMTQTPLKQLADRADYTAYASAIVAAGLCRSYVNVRGCDRGFTEPLLRAEGGRVRSMIDDPLLRFENVGPGMGHFKTRPQYITLLPTCGPSGMDVSACLPHPRRLGEWSSVHLAACVAALEAAGDG